MILLPKESGPGNEIPILVRHGPAQGFCVALEDTGGKMQHGSTGGFAGGWSVVKAPGL